MPKTWSDRVKALAERAGGLEALAVEVGVSFYTILRWRDGLHKPSHLARKRIEEIEKRKEVKR